MVASKFFVTVCPPPSRAKTGPAIEMARTVHAAAIMARNFMRFLPLLTSRFSVFMPPSLPARAALPDAPGHGDRKSVVMGKRVSVRGDLGGRRSIKKKNQ